MAANAATFPDARTISGSVSGEVQDAPCVVIPKRALGRTVNIWLILLVALGGAIAVGDGLTRGPLIEREQIWNAQFQYEPYGGTFLFAAVALPLTFAYARKSKISLAQALFLWFVFCTAAYTRDFSYIRLPGAPLFVTDLVLVVLFFAATANFRRRGRPCLPHEAHLFLALFLLAGVVSAARGFWTDQNGILILRDLTLVIYPFFLVVAHHLCPSWMSIKRVFVWFLLGTTLGALNGLGWFIASPGGYRFVGFGIYTVISLVGVTLATLHGLVRARTGLVFFGLLMAGLVLGMARTLVVTVLLLSLFTLLSGRTVLGKIPANRVAVVFATVTLVAVVTGFVFIRSESFHEFIEQKRLELASGLLHSSDDPNWQFRLAAWREGWKRFCDSPVGGEGFGIPFDIGGGEDQRPHNTFLTVLSKMGLVGFLPLFLLIIYLFWIGISALRRHSGNAGGRLLLRIIVLSQLAMCVYGSANLMLESPFLASLFWAGVGLEFRIVRLLDLETSGLLHDPSH